MELKTLGKNPTKPQELEFIQAVADSIPENSYLHSLFNPSFVHWVETRIRDDGSCDMYGELSQALLAGIAKGAAVEKAQEMVDKLAIQHQEAERQLGESIQRQSDTIEYMTTDLHRAQAQLVEIQRNYADDRTSWDRERLYYKAAIAELYLKLNPPADYVLPRTTDV